MVGMAWDGRKERGGGVGDGKNGGDVAFFWGCLFEWWMK